MSRDDERDPTGQIVVHIDPDLEDLIPLFMENRQNDIVAIREALKTGDFNTVRTLGHSMKGSGGGYGFDSITTIGAFLEQAAKDADTEGALRHLEDLVDYVKRVRVVYD